MKGLRTLALFIDSVRRTERAIEKGTVHPRIDWRTRVADAEQAVVNIQKEAANLCLAIDEDLIRDKADGTWTPLVCAVRQACDITTATDTTNEPLRDVAALLDSASRRLGQAVARIGDYQPSDLDDNLMIQRTTTRIAVARELVEAMVEYLTRGTE